VLEAVCSSEMSADFQRATRRYIPKIVLFITSNPTITDLVNKVSEGLDSLCTIQMEGTNFPPDLQPSHVEKDTLFVPKAVNQI
jgi:hypothetical protein